GRPDAPPGAGPALLLTDDDELADAVSRLAAAAGCALRRDSGPPAEHGEPPLLLLAGADVPAAEVVRARAEAAETVLVGLAPVDADWWRRAAEVDADHAALLPEAESWLLERLADAGEGAASRGGVVGVLGG
ncbi:septum formation initiator, partial [Kineococcus sp. R8]